MTGLLRIRKVEDKDASAIARIYNHYILHSVTTFEEDILTDQQMLQRIQQIRQTYPYLVGEIEGNVVGYAYANQWKARSAYRYTAESSIYIDVNHHGLGYGKQLYRQLITASRDHGIRMLIGGISLPNPNSIQLHEMLGFKYLGTFHRVGWKLDRWIDVGYWELHL